MERAAGLRIRAGALATRRFGRASTKFTQDARHRSWLSGSAELILHPAERWVLPVLDLDPAIGPTTAISAVAVLETKPSRPSRQAWRNRSGPISPCSKSLRKIRSTRRASSRERLALRIDSGRPAEILAIAYQDVEGVELDLGTSRTSGEQRMAAAVATTWCFPICRAATRDGAHPRRGFAAAMEAAAEWRQAGSPPRPRSLEALRDDRCVKAALATARCGSCAVRERQTRLGANIKLQLQATRDLG